MALAIYEMNEAFRERCFFFVSGTTAEMHVVANGSAFMAQLTNQSKMNV